MLSFLYFDPSRPLYLCINRRWACLSTLKRKARQVASLALLWTCRCWRRQITAQVAAVSGISLDLSLCTPLCLTLCPSWPQVVAALDSALQRRCACGPSRNAACHKYTIQFVAPHTLEYSITHVRIMLQLCRERALGCSTAKNNTCLLHNSWNNWE